MFEVGGNPTAMPLAYVYDAWLALRPDTFAWERPGADGDLTADAVVYLVQGRIPVTPAERDALSGVLARFTGPNPHHEYLDNPERTLATLVVTKEKDA